MVEFGQNIENTRREYCGLVTPFKGECIMNEATYGDLNAHAVGIIMKELVRRAIKAIRNQRIVFEVQEKKTEGKEFDIVTSADKAAQKVYLKSLQECFPGFGIVAEEEDFKLSCTLPIQNLDFSVDPLDGTKAFGRRQSHGIGTQIALRSNTEIISAWVGDVMTQEIYGFRPGSGSVWRINEYEVFEQLVINPEKPLNAQYLLMRENPGRIDCVVARRMNSQDWPAAIARPLFKDIEVEGGSIALSFARLWKGEVGGLLMAPYTETPWDTWPTIGISQKMGFAFFWAGQQSERWNRYTPNFSTQIQYQSTNRLIIHESRVTELIEWQK